MTDVRLHVRVRDAYFYPDLAVTGSPADQSTDPSDASVFREPSLNVEVLSDSTERFDRGEKFDVYKLIPTFSEYLLISANGRYAEIHRRQTGENWSKAEFREGNIPLTSLPATLDIAVIYEGIVF
jgi:Uma2 family endonuclease